MALPKFNLETFQLNVAVVKNCWMLRLKLNLTLHVPITDKGKKLTEMFFLTFFVVPQKILRRL